MEDAAELLEKYFNQEKISYIRIEETNEKIPDFKARVSEKEVFIEVKSFEEGESDVPFNRGSRFFIAAYPPGMEKIRNALRYCSKQFERYQNEINMCVLCNAKSILIDLDTQIVGMAMFGDIEIRLPGGDNNLDFVCNRNGPSQILRKEDGSLISAVAVLESKETWWRLRIIHNPYARTPLPIEIFKGRFDEEWNSNRDGVLEKITKSLNPLPTPPHQGEGTQGEHA